MPCHCVQDETAFSRVCQVHMHNTTMFPTDHDFAVVAARHLGFEDVHDAKQSDFEKFATVKDLVSASAMLHVLPQRCQMLFALNTIVPRCVPAASSGAWPALHWPSDAVHMSACQPPIATRCSSLCVRNQLWPTSDPGNRLDCWPFCGAGWTQSAPAPH